MGLVYLHASRLLACSFVRFFPSPVHRESAPNVAVGAGIFYTALLSFPLHLRPRPLALPLLFLPSVSLSVISETTIENVLAHLESHQEDFAQEFGAFAEAQPDLVAYLADEENDAFTEDEQEILLFGAIVIYQSVLAEKGEMPPATEEAISRSEEANYAVLGEGAGTFHDRITPFFERTKEEDLLAFIEDLLVYESEEDTLTKEAREPLFVTLKTVVDVLT